LADYGGNIFERQGSIYDIYGEMIREGDLDPEAVSGIRGEKVTFDEQRQQYVANCAGYPAVNADGRISVIGRLVLDGDISNLEEGIRSQVDLEINGNVGFTAISVAGDVSVNGNLRECSVFCAGNLNVDGDILSCREPGIEVLGNISCLTILSCKVLCRGKLEFERSLLNCEVAADGGINSREGALSGGHIECCGDIRVGRIGDSDGTPTEIEITISPYHKAQMMKLTKEVIKLKQDSQGNSEAIAALESRIRECENNMDSELNSFLARPPEERIRLLVQQDAFPPVQIRILKHEYRIRNHQVHLELIEKD
ncbi:MAG: FapA family protein, partial [Candidatus Syntrophosphaera sp.]